jgi:hypothetical protein
LDVDEPTPFANADIHALGAFMADRGASLRTYRGDIGIPDTAVLSGDDTGTTTGQSSENTESPMENLDPYSDSCDYHHFLFGPQMMESYPQPFFGLQTRPYSEVTSIPGFNRRRFELASQAVARYGPSCLNDTTLEVRWPKNFLTLRAKNRPRSTEILSSRKTTLEHTLFARSLLIAGPFYGSIHLSVWNRAFRGDMDELLWNSSARTILCSGPIFLLLWAISNVLTHFGRWIIILYQGYSKHRKDILVKRLRFWVGWSALGMTGIFLLFYVLCRIFVIVECFLDVNTRQIASHRALKHALIQKSTIHCIKHTTTHCVQLNIPSQYPRPSSYPLTHPISPTPNSDLVKPHNLPLIQRSQHRANRTASHRHGSREIQRSPLIHQRMHILALRDIGFNSLVCQRSGRQFIFLSKKSVVGGLDE